VGRACAISHANYYKHSVDHEANGNSDDTGILSRYPIAASTRYGATIYLTQDDPVHIYNYNVHLSPSPYEPYGLRDGKIDVEEAVAQARSSRYPEIQLVLTAMQDPLERGDPVFLLGDFNEPSHLDWTAAAARADMHLGKEVEWPISKEIARHGLSDACRTVYPDEVKHPGQTWTTLTDRPNEVHDRIDFVYFAGEDVQAVDAYTLGLRAEAPTDRAGPGYPSDHRSVVGVFTLGGEDSNSSEAESSSR